MRSVFPAFCISTTVLHRNISTDKGGVKMDSKFSPEELRDGLNGLWVELVGHAPRDFISRVRKYIPILEEASRQFALMCQTDYIWEMHYFKEHAWKLDEEGHIDDMAWEAENHNGPVCTRCGESPCVYCKPNFEHIGPCIVNVFICPVCGKRSDYGPDICTCGKHLVIPSEPTRVIYEKGCEPDGLGKNSKTHDQQ